MTSSCSSISSRSLGSFIDSKTVPRCRDVSPSCVNHAGVRRSVPSNVFQSRTASLVVTRLEHGKMLHLPESPLDLSTAYNRFFMLLLGKSSACVNEIMQQTPKSQHWLRAAEIIDFKLAITVYRRLHGTAPSYSSRDAIRNADLPSRSRLRSSSSTSLIVPRCRLYTIGHRAFAVADARVWNSLFHLVSRRRRHWQPSGNN